MNFALILKGTGVSLVSALLAHQFSFLVGSSMVRGTALVALLVFGAFKLNPADRRNKTTDLQHLGIFASLIWFQALVFSWPIENHSPISFLFISLIIFGIAYGTYRFVLPVLFPGHHGVGTARQDGNAPGQTTTAYELGQQVAKAINPTSDSATAKPTTTEDSSALLNTINAATSEIYARVADELESGTYDKGLWTMLYAQCDGDETKTKVQYIRLRVNQFVADATPIAEDPPEPVAQEFLSAPTDEARSFGLSVEEVEYLGTPIKAVRYKVKYGVSEAAISKAINFGKLKSVICNDVLWVQDRPI